MSVSKNFEEYYRQLSVYEAQIEFNPQQPDVYNNLGSVYWKLEDYNKAIDAYKAAITINSSFANAHLNLGSLYLKMGRQDEAIAEFHQVIEADSSYNIQVNFAIGRTYALNLFLSYSGLASLMLINEYNSNTLTTKLLLYLFIACKAYQDYYFPYSPDIKSAAMITTSTSIAIIADKLLQGVIIEPSEKNSLSYTNTFVFKASLIGAAVNEVVDYLNIETGVIVGATIGVIGSKAVMLANNYLFEGLFTNNGYSVNIIGALEGMAAGALIGAVADYFDKEASIFKSSMISLIGGNIIALATTLEIGKSIIGPNALPVNSIDNVMAAGLANIICTYAPHDLVSNNPQEISTMLHGAAVMGLTLLGAIIGGVASNYETDF
jgi:hypothetical protein